VIHWFGSVVLSTASARGGIGANVQFEPAPAQAALLGRTPLALAEQLKTRAVHRQVDRLDARPWAPWAFRKSPTTPVQGCMVRHGQMEAKQREHAAGEPFRLVQG